MHQAKITPLHGDRRKQAGAPPLKPVPHYNLPVQPTALVGRDLEVERAWGLLQKPEVRLLTLVGPGGVGKTRLAIEVAEQLYPDFEEGVCYVELAPVSDPALVMPTIAQTLGLEEDAARNLQTALLEYLRSRSMLLVLDNFEQVLAAAQHITEMLAACSHVKVIVTSREPLRLRGEQELQVQPLALPVLDKDANPNVAALSVSPAVALFMQRAGSVRPDFAMNESNARAIAEICIRVDGLPLAIELAAARLKVLSPQALLARLQSALQILTGGPNDLPSRQQTIRNTIEWSYNLLDEQEQQVFRHISVFVGGSTLEAAERVIETASNDDVGNTLDLLLSLVDKSLLRQIDLPGGESRLTMLETIRQYALEKLEERGEAKAVRRRHADYFRSMVDEAEPKLKGPEQIEWLNRLDPERDNLRAVFAWSLSEHPDTDTDTDTAPGTELAPCTLGLRVAGGLLRLWQVRGPLSEAQDWLDRLLKLDDEAGPAILSGDRDRMAARARALSTAGRVNYLNNMQAESQTYHREAHDLHMALGDKSSAITSLMGIANIFLTNEQADKAEPIYEECLRAWREIGAKPGIAAALSNLGIAAIQKGNFKKSEELAREALVVITELGDKERIAAIKTNLARALLGLGQYEEADSQMKGSLAMHIEIEDVWGAAYTVEGLGELACAQGQYGKAARLFGASGAHYEGMRERLDPQDLVTYDRCVGILVAQMGREAYEAAVAEGGALIPEQAGAYEEPMEGVLATTRRVGSAKQEIEPGDKTPLPNLLSTREMEVLRLVAAGLSDSDIAEQLFLSKHTVNAHLRNIYSKIDVTSRSAATRYALDNGFV